jgi:hypothetical protein
MMGEGMFVHIAKGSVHKKVDATVNDNTGGMFDKRAALLAALEGATTSGDYLTVLQTRPLMTQLVTQAEADYLSKTWYNEGRDGWWPWLQPIYPILKAGLIKAIRVATERNLPLDSYWLVGSNQVEVIVIALPGAQQVLRLILTPPGLAPTQTRPNRIDIWSIRRSLGWAVGNETPEEVVESLSQGNVVTFQQKEL